jgi:hypothetical protein
MTPMNRRWVMRQRIRARASKIGDGALIAVVGLAIAAFWAGVAVFFWLALKPYRLLVGDLWELIPAGARPATGLGLAIAGGVLLLLFILAVIAGKPARRSHAAGTPGAIHVGVDIDAGDIDVSGL